MDLAKSFGRNLFYGVWAVLTTALTYILGAVSLKVLRRRLGRLIYWSSLAVASAGMYFAGAKILGIAFLSLVILVGVFSELEELGLGFMLSAFFTLIINSLLAAGAFAIWVYSTGPKWSQQVLVNVETWLKPLADLNPRLQINYYDLMLQLPSIAIILWMGAIYLAVLLEQRLTGTDLAPGAPQDQTPALGLRAQLAEFRLPDPVVWLFILALLGGFGNFGIKPLEAVAINVLNVCFVLFFFQGIAVVGKFFETLRMGMFWQFLFMVLIIVHLFMFVSLVGLVDYWVDFRARLTKRTEEFNREI